jgi:hypothetical protein
VPETLEALLLQFAAVVHGVAEQVGQLW